MPTYTLCAHIYHLYKYEYVQCDECWTKLNETCMTKFELLDQKKEGNV